MGCVIIFTPPLRLQRQEPHIGLQARVSCFGALNTMDKKRKYSELNSNGGGAIYVAAGLPPDLPLEIVRQIFEAFGKVESINVSSGVMAGQTLQEKESLVTVTFEQSDAEKAKVCLPCLAKIWVPGSPLLYIRGGALQTRRKLPSLKIPNFRAQIIIVECHRRTAVM